MIKIKISHLKYSAVNNLGNVAKASSKKSLCGLEILFNLMELS